MSIRIIFVVASILLWQSVRSEESFCGNKCYGDGVVMSRSCFCDEACVIYSDCCSDSKHLQSNSTDISRSVTCRSNNLMVNSCSKDWNGPDFIIKSCTSSPGDGDVDPVGSAPVTSETTGLTYSNYYCAICNGDADKILMWNIKMSCPLLNADMKIDKDEVFKYIFFNNPTKEWGYVLRDDTTKKMSFHGCAVASEAPEHPSIMVRSCDSDDVRSCVPSWKMALIKDMCEETYTDPVYSNGTKYKNFYCAICNHVDQSSLTCGQAVRPRSSKKPESEEKNNLSFSLLLDINFSEGNAVGKRLAAAACLKGEVFDPFARRCRNIVCGIPGYVLQNRMCVPDLEPPIL